ncbi:hypothetical protein NFI96_004458 [Prochilodus magdalenae]|nr:hypothetical protein NFI96_004458 [Prochilodus magdalenae]
MGLEAENSGGIIPDDIIKALKGHILDGYTFNPVHAITKDNPKYNANPNPCDKVHCLVTILPADTISRMSDKVIDKMKTIREKVKELKIPQVIVLTKVDQACQIVKEDLEKIYYSRKIKEKVEVCSNILGISLNSIYPVKNYYAEIIQHEDTDNIILMALRDIVNFANDYVEEMTKTDDVR